MEGHLDLIQFLVFASTGILVIISWLLSRNCPLGQGCRAVGQFLGWTYVSMLTTAHAGAKLLNHINIMYPDGHPTKLISLIVVGSLFIIYILRRIYRALAQNADTHDIIRMATRLVQADVEKQRLEKRLDQLQTDIPGMLAQILELRMQLAQYGERNENLMKQINRHTSDMDIQASTWRDELEKGAEKRMGLECEILRWKSLHQDLEGQLYELKEKIKGFEGSLADTNSQSIVMQDANVTQSDKPMTQNKMLSERRNLFKLPIKRKISEVYPVEPDDKDIAQLKFDVDRLYSLTEHLRNNIHDARKQFQCAEKKATMRKKKLQDMKGLSDSLSNKLKALTELVNDNTEAMNQCVVEMGESVKAWKDQRYQYEFVLEPHDPVGELHALAIINIEQEAAVAKSIYKLEAMISKLREDVEEVMQNRKE